jgi:FkbM family methyltransferase
MSDGHFERDAGALVSSGFTPKRMSLPVRVARRVLWPLIRPFHLFTLRTVSDLQGSMATQRDQMVMEVDSLRAEVAQIRRMYAHLAVQLRTEEEERARFGVEAAGAIHGLQQIADGVGDDLRLIQGDLFAAMSNRIDHVQRLYGHLADEMPKFVQPLVDFRSESAAILNRFRIYGADLDALKTRCEGLERTSSATTADLQQVLDDVASLSGRFENFAGDMDQRCSQLDERLDERCSQLDGRLDERYSQLDGRLDERTNALDADLARTSGDLRGLIDGVRSDLTQLADREDHLERSTRSVEAAVGEVRATGDQRDTELTHRIGAVDAKIELASARQDQEIKPKIDQLGLAVSAVQEALLGPQSLTSEIRQLKARVEAPHIVLETVEDGVLLLNSADLIARIVRETGQWDPHVIEVMRQVARDRRGVAVDVGAHCGLHTVAMSRAFDQVVAFEPNDVSYCLLQANVALNRLDNVTLHNRPLFSREANLALGRPHLQETPIPRDSRGDLNMAAAPNPGSLFFLPVDGGREMPFQHASLTLDGLDLPGLDFLKIDVQGADGEVICGGRSTIERFKPVIVFEWEDKLSENFSISMSDVKGLLGSMGYTVSVLKSHNEKQCDYVAMPIGV